MAVNAHMMSDTEKTILRTLIFFDIFEYPLTLFELWKFAYGAANAHRPSLSDCIRVLYPTPSLSMAIVQRNGFYVLAGREEIIEMRRERTIFADKKYAIAQKITRVFARIPFVRMVCACNTVGLGAPKEESDIDLFIVARAHHLWLVRLLCTGYVHLLGRRPRRDAVRDTICLSFYASDDALDFSTLARTPIGAIPDIYFLYWIMWCVPIYDDGVYELFFRANAWTERYLPNRISYLPVPYRRVVLSRVGMALKRIIEWAVRLCGPWAERGARAFQYLRMPRAIRDLRGTGTGVVVSDAILKFHIGDRRWEIQERFIKKCREIGIE